MIIQRAPETEDELAASRAYWASVTGSATPRARPRSKVQLPQEGCRCSQCEQARRDSAPLFSRGVD